MKYQIRKVAQCTVFTSSEVAELDPEDFRNHESNPYKGNSEEEFIQYIANFYFDDTETETFSSETVDELLKIFDGPTMTQHYSTVQDFEDSWFEVGEKNEQFRKAGGFDVHHSHPSS